MNGQPSTNLPAYTPEDWYFRRGDGSLYSTARILTVSPDDADYVAWKGVDPARVPSLYPRDEAGVESPAELAKALAQFPGAFASLPDYVASLRYAAEVAGVEVAGMAIATDRESQNLINGAFNLVSAKPDMTIRFKVGGQSIRLGSAEVHIVAITVGEHVQACREREGAVLDAIEAGTVKTRAEAEAAFAAA